ncbi:DUF4401 domain-containing protein [Myroides marinus]|uniref:DUF4401 domain-containing protein n=1 Tax=Myroides marinus TaxID=703342 RepID=UPI002576A08C|nr:DUF4401 domain-containing protein [Myroides marinus]MDM1374268.1 DUF4401 domain-containing protein [Myroides marinus]
MSNNLFKDLVSSVEQAGVEVNHEALQVAKDKLAMKSIIIRVISILGSLLGLGLFIGFIALAASDIFQEAIAFILMGVLFLGGAFALNRSNDGAITVSIAVSLYIIGYAFLSYGLSNDGHLMGYSMFVIALITLFLYNNHIISFLSSLSILVAIHFIMFDLDIQTFYYIYLAIVLAATTYLFWQEQRLRTMDNLIGHRYLPIFAALFTYTLVTGIISSTQQFGYYYFSEFRGVRLFFITVLVAALLFTVHLVLDKMKVSKLPIQIATYLLVIIFNVLVAYYYPAFGIACLFILWGFMRQFKAGFAVGIATLVWAMGMFYYDLGVSLLAKSISLMIVGALFLAIYYLIQKKGEKYDNI